MSKETTLSLRISLVISSLFLAGLACTDIENSNGDEELPYRGPAIATKDITARYGPFGQNTCKIGRDTWVIMHKPGDAIGGPNVDPVIVQVPENQETTNCPKDTMLEASRRGFDAHETYGDPDSKNNDFDLGELIVWGIPQRGQPAAVFQFCPPSRT